MAKYDKWLEPDGLLRVEGWARSGLTDEQIASNMGIGKTTLYDWKKKYPNFANSLKQNKDIVDIQVENALLKRALGYSYEETTYERVEHLVIDPRSGDTIVEPGTKIKTVVKQLAPDTTAQIFWLKNRKPNEWRDKKDVGVTFDKNLEDFFSSDEE